MDRKNAPHRLLVEGSDDFHTIIHLLKRHYLDWDTGPTKEVCVVDCKGYMHLLDALEVVPVQKPGGRLGFVVDADTDPGCRWSSLRGKLSSAGVDLPEGAKPGEVFFDFPVHTNRLGFWLMPDNSHPGTLEHFLEMLIPDSQKALWEHARTATDRAVELKAPFWNKESPNHNLRKKAEIHALLAWQKDPGNPFGTAMKAEVFRHDSQEATQFLAWFRRLFLES